MYKYSEKEMIDGLISWDETIIKYIIKINYPTIKSMVLKYRNTLLNPMEIFHRGLYILRDNLLESKFKGQSIMSTYLYSICRNLCRKEFKRMEGFTELSDNYKGETFDTSDKTEILDKLLILKNKLSEDCKEIINLRLRIGERDPESSEYRSYDEIAQIRNIEVANARQLFHRCKEKLISLVKDDQFLNKYLKNNVK